MAVTYATQKIGDYAYTCEDVIPKTLYIDRKGDYLWMLTRTFGVLFPRNGGSPMSFLGSDRGREGRFPLRRASHEDRLNVVIQNV